MSYYRTLIKTQAAPPPIVPVFELVVKSDNTGTSDNDQFTIPTTGAGYLYDIETSDGYVATGVTGNHTITFPSGAGTREVYITGDFPRIFFNNVGDRLKVLEVTNWGTYGVSQADQSRAFFGCNNLSQIASGGAWFDVVINGFAMFANCGLTSLPEGMDMPLMTNGSLMFQNNSLTSLPSGIELPALTNGGSMFFNNSLTSLPSGIELPALTNGGSMFANNSLTSLPIGMELPLLTAGAAMFQNNSLTSLPSGMELPALTNGSSMFFNNSLTSLPIGMELPLLTIGQSMFQNNSITDLPSGMELPVLTNGGGMFFNNSLTSLPSVMELPLLETASDMFRSNAFTDIPTGMTLPALTNGTRMFQGNTINTTRYSQLLVDLESGNANNSVAFSGGNSKYNATGETARNILTGATRLWTITDGGLE